MVLATVVVALVCFSVLVVAATYGILHHGDDFNFVNRSNGGGGGDIIHLPAGLP
jgi:hypothetical protein